MRLIEFLKVIAGLAIGILATWSVFGIGHIFIENVFSEDKPDMFICTISAMIWIVVSYGIITLVF